MSDEGFKRKLTAILSADAVDYSRLMGDDEEATVRTLNTYREVFTSLIQQHNGKVLDSTGDNLLAEFVSVVDAVQCAVAVQKEIKSRNDELAENRRMQFRIGINLGDVIQEKDRIYGDGVNIAARLEGLAEPGGICISKTAFDHIESKLPYGYDYLGDQTVKNIAKPVGAYRVLMDPRVTVSGKSLDAKPSATGRKTFLIGAAAVIVVVIAVVIWQFYSNRLSTQQTSVSETTTQRSEKPSIAVMPFKNLSGDPEQDFISDGISDNIISVLSKDPGLSVIARNSTFFYKDKQVQISQVGRELGARFILEGSILKSGEQIRINAQLIEASKGHHVWSETYDRKWTDFLSILDEITLAVAKGLISEVGLPFKEGPNIQTTDNTEAWLLFNKAGFHNDKFSREDNAKAIDLLRQVIEIDPNWSNPYALLGIALNNKVRYRWTQSSEEPEELVKQAKEMAHKAIELDDSNPYPRATLGEIYLNHRKYDDALVEYKKAVDSDPNWDMGYYFLARCLVFAGQPEEALPYIKEAMHLNPHYMWGFPTVTARIYYHTGRYEEALAEVEKIHEICSRGDCWMYFPHLFFAMVYGKSEQVEKAQYHMKKVLEENPRFNLEGRQRVSLFRNKEDTNREINGLRKAGAPEHPPSQ
jgi:adenylate cyclase